MSKMGPAPYSTSSSAGQNYPSGLGVIGISKKESRSLRIPAEEENVGRQQLNWESCDSTGWWTNAASVCLPASNH